MTRRHCYDLMWPIGLMPGAVIVAMRARGEPMLSVRVGACAGLRSARDGRGGRQGAGNRQMLGPACMYLADGTQ